MDHFAAASHLVAEPSCRKDVYGEPSLAVIAWWQGWFLEPLLLLGLLMVAAWQGHGVIVQVVTVVM
jgi:hypothetical protein